MKESGKQKTAVRSGKGKSATVPPIAGRKSILVLAPIRDYGAPERKIYLDDVVAVEEASHWWGNGHDYVVKVRTMIGTDAEIRIFNGDERKENRIKLDGKKVTLEQAVMVLQNAATGFAISELPDGENTKD